MVGACAAAITGAVSLLLPKMYKAEVRILPSGGGSSALQALAGASGLPNILEIATQHQENPVQTFPEIILGRVVLDRTLHRPFPPNDTIPGNDVMKALRVKGASPREKQYRGVKELHEVVSVSANPRTGIIGVSAETRDSTLSAYIANSLISELDRFNLETRRSQGRAVREFVASRLDQAQDELNRAETGLASFRQSNLRIGNSPQLNLEEERLKRAVLIRTEAYQLLAHQFEIARIEEYRDTPTFSIVEPAIPPFRKSRPMILLNALIGFVLAALASIPWRPTLRAMNAMTATMRR